MVRVTKFVPTSLRDEPLPLPPPRCLGHGVGLGPRRSLWLMLSTVVRRDTGASSLGGGRWLLAKRFVYPAHVNVTGWHKQESEC